jgi:hypothetical protein
MDAFIAWLAALGAASRAFHAVWFGIHFDALLIFCCIAGGVVLGVGLVLGCLLAGIMRSMGNDPSKW